MSKNTRFGKAFKRDIAALSERDLAFEINALNKHRRTIPDDDILELAECLTCIELVRARQHSIASQKAKAARLNARSYERELELYRKKLERTRWLYATGEKLTPAKRIEWGLKLAQTVERLRKKNEAAIDPMRRYIVAA